MGSGTFNLFVLYIHMYLCVCVYIKNGMLATLQFNEYIFFP